MVKNKLLEKLKNGKTVIGLINSCRAPYINEVSCNGWDYIWIDAQHSEFDRCSTLQAVLAASRENTDTVIRVPGSEYGIIGPYADMGCSAIMVPMVDNKSQAEKVRDAIKFPPVGKRSFGGFRIAKYFGVNYYKEYELLSIAQIETADGINNIESIINTEGIDMIFVGMDDIKVNLGFDIGQPTFENDKLVKILETLSEKVNKAGKYAGCVAVNADAAKRSIDLGYRFLACSVDLLLLQEASNAKLREIRTAID